MDFLSKAICNRTKISLTSTDVTMSCKALAARHLCGPTAGMVQAEAISVVSLLSADSASADEAVSLRLQASGPIAGLTVEATGEGGLRGFTNTKVMNDLDGNETITTPPALGSYGTIQIIRSLPGKILNQAQLQVDPPELRTVLARYYNHSVQIPSAVAISVEANSGGLIHARALVAHKMPDSDSDTFVNVLEQFHGPGVDEFLTESADMQKVCRIFDLPDLQIRETRPLQFRCRCTQEKTNTLMETLSTEELKEIVARMEPQHIICHMCGQDYDVPVTVISSILRRKCSGDP